MILPGQAEGEVGRERVLREAGFVDVTSRHFDETVEVRFASIARILESSSVCSRKALGPTFDAFCDDLRQALGADDGSTFRETIHWSDTFTRKPA